MKTFDSFLLEGISDKLKGMSDEQFDQFLKGRTSKEAANFRDLRNGKDKNKGKGGQVDYKATKKEEPKSSGGSIVKRTGFSGGGTGGNKTSPPSSGGTTGENSNKAPQGRTGGLGAKSKPYDKQRAASGPAGGVRPSRPYRSGQDQPAITPAEKQRREAEKKKKKKGKGIDFGKFAKDAVGAAARYDVSPEVKTKEAEDFAKV